MHSTFYGDVVSGYTIEQAAERIGLTKYTLRYYEREGLLPPVAKGANGHRRSSDEDLGRLTFIQLLRATGMPIREMKDFMTLTWAGDHTIPARVDVLTRYRAVLVQRMASDREHLAFLNQKIDTYTRMLPS